MLNRFKYNIGKEIELNIISAIKASLKSDAKDSFSSIDGFILQSINNFFRKDKISEFIYFLKLVEQYYIIATTGKNQNETSKIILNRCSKRLYESILLPNFDFEKASYEDKERINKYKYQIFKSFNRVFFETVKNKDLSGFKRNIEQLNLIFMGTNPDLFPLSESLVDSPTIEKSNNLFVDMKSQIYYNQTLLGIKYWIYFLYEKNEIELDLMKSFLQHLEKTKKINTFFWEIEYLFSELNSIKGLTLYDWSAWDYKEHDEGRSYSLPNVQSWITKGYVIDSLKRKNLSIINVNSEIISDNPQNKEMLISILKEDLDKIKNNEKWQVYLGEIDDKNIKNQLGLLEFSFASKKAKEISATKLDDTLIADYRKRFLEVWKKNQIIRDIFNHFGKKIEYHGTDKLKLNGNKVYFENGKVLFINGPHHVNINGTEDYGRQMNVDEESYFLNKVYEAKVPTIYESLIYGIEDSITKIKEFEITAIIIDNNLLYTNEFKSLLSESVEIPQYFYKGIPVFTINNNSLRNRFIIANFQEAFTMLYRSNENLLDRELKVDVYEVTPEILKEKLVNNGNPNLSEEDNKDRIMSSVIIDFEVIVDFKIENENAFVIGYVEEL